MDAQARKKEFRAKLKEQARKSRIDSPLVRYNEIDQPVCRVCNVVLKSESLWPAHQASKKHHEAINDLKTKASRPSPTTNSTSLQNKELPVGKTDGAIGVSTELHKAKPSQALPANFFDSSESKIPKTGSGATKQMGSNSLATKGPPLTKAPVSKQATAAKVIPESVATETKKSESEYGNNVAGTEAAAIMKGALPEGFFDNKDADLRARGIEPVKPDVNDEYKEFEKLIQPDLKEVDNRYEEEEVDAADVIEEEETVEQMSYKDRIEMLKRKRTEMVSAKSNKRGEEESNEQIKKKPKKDEPSSDDDDDDDDEEDFTVDWRAQHL